MCPDPLTQVVDRPMLTVPDYKSPALEGDTVNFSCSFSGEVVVGPNMSTCTRGGVWEPDPKEINCDMMTNRQMLIPNLQHVQITSILVGSLLGVVLLLLTITTIIVASNSLLKGRIKGLYYVMYQHY